MFNSVKDQTSSALSSQRRSLSVGKSYKSAANSPTATKLFARSQISHGKGKGQGLNYFTQNLSQLKMSYYSLKEDHLTFQNEIFTFMEGFKHIISEFGHDLGGNKTKNQMTTKVLQLVSELDSMKFEMKKRLEEKDERIKELQVRLREKDQEVCLIQTQLDVKKEEIKTKESYIIRLEKSGNLVKQQHQQELTRIENDKTSLENRYLRELASLKQEKEDIKLRLDKQTHREKQIPVKVGPSKVSDHGRYESLNHEINLLREDKKHLASQLQTQQTKNKNLSKEKEQSKRLLEESQEILKELEGKVHSLSQELEESLESKSFLQYQFDQSINHLKEARQELDRKVMQLEEANTQLEDKSSQINELRDRLNQQVQLSASQRNTARTSSYNRNAPTKSRNEKSLNTTVDFNSEREGIKSGEQDTTLTSQRQTNRSIHKESSSQQTRKGDGNKTITNLIRQTLKEKELQEKLSKVEETCKSLKSKYDTLKTENANLTAKLVIKDNSNSDLRQKLEKFKEQTKSTFSSFDNDNSMSDEIKYLRKLAQGQEKDLKKADLEIKKLNAVKKELEIVLKDSREETQMLKSSYTTRGHETSDLDSTYIKAQASIQDIDPKLILPTLSKEMEHETQLKLTTAENESNKMNKDSKILVLLDEVEIESLQKENYDLRMELLSKDTKLQDLMKLSTNSLKIVTEEFMKMASNKFIGIHERIFKLLNRWSKFENFTQKEILKNLNMTNSKEAKKKTEEKGNTRSVLSDRTLRRENTPIKNKVLVPKLDNSSRPRSSEEKAKKTSTRAYHSEKKTMQSSKETHSFNQRTRLSEKKQLSKSTDDFEKDSNSKELNEEDLSLHQILEEVRYLKKFFTFDDENGPIISDQKQSNHYDAKDQQKVFELLSNALSPKEYMNQGLEDIKETEHETDTLQDEINSSTSNVV